MRHIPYTTINLVSDNELASVQGSLEVGALALGSMLLEQREFLTIISSQAKGMEDLMALQNGIVDILNVASDNEQMAYEAKLKIQSLLNVYITTGEVVPV